MLAQADTLLFGHCYFGSAVCSMQVAATREGCLLHAPCLISSYSFCCPLELLQLPKPKLSLSCDSWDLNKFVTYCAMIQYQLFRGIIAMTDGRRV